MGLRETMVPRRAHPARSTALVIVLAAVGLALATRLMSLSNNATLSAQNGAPDAVALAQLASATPPPQAGTPGATATLPSTLTPVAGAFEVGLDLTIEYLRGLDIQGSEITFEQQLANGANYAQYIASYVSEGNRIYGLLTVPFGEMPPGGYKAIVFNHGYIPPASYRTTERYVAYVDTLARAGFVVFKIDLRGHGSSEGEPSGSYYSPAYTIDAIAALKSLQTLDFVDPDGIGMWGHSMAGNLVLRAMLIEPDIKAGVIWAGAVYSYGDLAAYGISDSSFVRAPDGANESPGRRRGREIREAYGEPGSDHPYWQAVSLSGNIRYLQNPLQLHHAANDSVVSVAYSRDLSGVLQANNKVYEYYEYEGGEHNIESPYFETAMLRTIEFFQKYL